MPLESEELEFHRWITELNCATCRATYVQSFWKSRNETEGWEKTLLPDPIAQATAGICTAPYSINIQKPLLHFPKSKDDSKSKLLHLTPLFVLPLTQCWVVWLVVGSVLFLFLTSCKYVLHLAKRQLGTKKRTAKWCFRSQERSIFKVNCTSFLFI